MMLRVLLQISTFFALASSNLFVPVAQFNECPRAVLTCNKSSEKDSQYVCAAAANQPSAKHVPQYSWTVSAGRIIDDPAKPNITIEVDGVKAESVIVMLKVKWTKMPPTCDVSEVKKIQLR